MKVRVNGNKQAAVFAPKNYDDVPGQGRISYLKETPVTTPKTDVGHVLVGEKRGMGAAMRGSSFRCS